MASTLYMRPVAGEAGTYEYEPGYEGALTVPVSQGDLNLERENLMTMLTSPGTSPYTPELTEQVLEAIKRRNAQSTAANVAAAQSDMLRRGGTGSSTEYANLREARNLGAQTEADQVLQFMLGAADAAAENRRFNVETGLNLYGTDVGRAESGLSRLFSRGSALEGYRFQADQAALDRENEQMLADKYMTQLAAQQAAERKASRRSGLGGALGSLAGAGLGAMFAAPTGGLSMGAGAYLGSQMGGNVGSSLPFLFS